MLAFCVWRRFVDQVICFLDLWTWASFLIAYDAAIHHYCHLLFMEIVKIKYLWIYLACWWICIFVISEHVYRHEGVDIIMLWS